jgi:signal transduction histidine kinase
MLRYFHYWILTVVKQISRLKTGNHKAVILLVSFLLFTVLNGISQTSTLDSLKYAASNASDSNKSKILLSIAKEYMYTNDDSLVFYGNKAIDYALLLEDKTMRIESLIELASINTNIGNRERSLLLYNQAKQLCLKEGNQYLLAKIYMDLERYYSALSDYASSLCCLDTALSIIKDNNISKLKPIIYNAYGNLYSLIQNFPLAYDYTNLAISFSTNETVKTNYIENLLLLGKIFSYTNELDSSLYYYSEALALAKEENYKGLIQQAYAQISTYYIEKMEYDNANYYIDSSIFYCIELALPIELASLITFKAHVLSLKGDYENTLKYNLQALEIRKRIGNKASICSSLLNIGGNYIKLMEYEKAHFYLNQGIKIAESQKLLFLLANGYDKLSELNKLEGNFKKALYFTELKTLYNDSITINRTNDKVIFFKNQFELEKLKTLEEKIKLEKKSIESIFLIITIILSVSLIFLLMRINYLSKRRTKEIIKAKERAEESDRLKSAFLATMSHELRTPLNAIIGFSNLIDEGTPIKDAVQYSKTVNASGNHLLNIVEDLFDISLIEAGQIKTAKQTIDLLHVLEELKVIIENEQKNLKKTHLDLSLEIPANIKKISLSIDVSKFKQLLINLLKNALKFTHEGHVHFGFELETKKNRLKFYVEDTGIGISKEMQGIIFDAFRQVDETYTKSYGGTGIGLSISKKIVKILGGEIWVESELGKGSTFFFTVPYDGVDDDDSSYDYLNAVLEMQEVNTLRAKNGKEAIGYCKEKPAINLVLMDINMPVMNGYEATKAIKKFQPNLPIIAQTAYAISGDREKALANGCDDYISKPLKKEELFMLLNKYLK